MAENADPERGALYSVLGVKHSASDTEVRLFAPFPPSRSLLTAPRNALWPLMGQMCAAGAAAVERPALPRSWTDLANPPPGPIRSDALSVIWCPNTTLTSLAAMLSASGEDA